MRESVFKKSGFKRPLPIEEGVFVSMCSRFDGSSLSILVLFFSFLPGFPSNLNLLSFSQILYPPASDSTPLDFTFMIFDNPEALGFVNLEAETTVNFWRILVSLTG